MISSLLTFALIALSSLLLQHRKHLGHSWTPTSLYRHFQPIDLILSLLFIQLTFSVM